MTDREAMNEIAEYISEFDPTLDESHPEWVWSLLGLLDDLMVETGRMADAN